MSDDSTTSTDAATHLEPPGALLKAARLKAGLYTQDIAKELNLSVTKLEALESDQHDKLISPVFVQGYLRRYGKLVSLDGDALVARYNAYRAQTGVSQEQNSEVRQDEQRLPVPPPTWLLPAGIFVLAIVVLAFVFIGNADDDARNTPPVLQQTEDTSAARDDVITSADRQADADQRRAAEADRDSPAAEPAPEMELQEVPEPMPEPETPPEADTDVSALADSQPPQAVDDTTTEPAASVVEQGVLSFAFAEDCWVEVSNAQGTVIHAELAEAGESLTIEGQAPFSIMLGNARGVTLSYNGEAVPVTPRPGNRTARLDVGGDREQVTGNRQQENR